MTIRALGRSLLIALAGLALPLTSLAASAGEAGEEALAFSNDPACAAAFDAPPADPSAIECWTASGSTRAQREALDARLAAWEAEQGEDPKALTARGILWVEAKGARAEPALRRAVALFRERGDGEGEAHALALLGRHFHRFRRTEELDALLERLEVLLGGESLVDALHPAVAARVVMTRINVAEAEGRIDEVLLLARRALVTPGFEELPLTQRHGLLFAASGAALQLDRYSEALAILRRTRGPCGGEPGCTALEVYQRAQIARLMHARLLEERERAAELTRLAVERARERGSRWAELREVCELGRYTDPPEALEWFERCAELASQLHCEDVRLFAESLHALGVATYEPSRLEESLARMPAIVEGLGRIGVWHDHVAAHAHWSTLLLEAGRVDEALALRERAVELVEAMYARQLDAATASAKVAFEARQFYDLAYLLALDERTRPAHDLTLALEILERFRVRASSLALRRAEVQAVPPGGERALAEADAAGRAATEESLAATSRSIVRAQVRLQDATLGRQAREALLEELERLEIDERRLRAERRRFARVGVDAPPLASLDELRALLAADEAFVSYQLASGPGEPSWAFVVDKRGARALRLSDEAIEPVLGLLLGLLSRRDGSETEALAALAERIVTPVIEDLDPGVRRLAIVPDGRLFDLPLGALPLQSGGPPLATRYALSLVTSASELVALRVAAPAALDALPRAAFALSYSPLPARAGPEPSLLAGALVRQGASSSLVSLAPLEEARAEARAVARLLGGASRVLDAQAASESIVKRADLAPYGVVHIAAHALANHERPERSAILLAAGGRDEDGLLQPREIAGLELAGRLVVLTACGSAQGAGARRGGPQSLAAAFLRGGASAVVGTLWPVRDAEARRFADLFYRHLARGESAAAALAAAQSELAASGEPAASWAAYVLYGEGGARLEKASQNAAGSSRARPLALALALVLFALAAAFALSRARVSGEFTRR